MKNSTKEQLITAILATFAETVVDLEKSYRRGLLTNAEKTEEISGSITTISKMLLTI